MNVKLLNDIADLIEKDKRAYDQSSCTRCVAAMTIELVGTATGYQCQGFGEVSDEAADELGLSDFQEEALFSTGWPENWYEAADCPSVPRDLCMSGDYVPTADDAVLVLRRMAANPDDWPWPEPVEEY